MGWDVVEIGLKHNLPVNDPFATAQEVAKRMKQNIRLVCRNEYEYDSAQNVVREAKGDEFIELGKYEVNNSKDYLQMIASDYQAHQIQESVGEDKLRNAAFTNVVESILDDIEDSFELYEIEGRKDNTYIRIFKENVDLDVSVIERWRTWEYAFRQSGEYREWLHNYRMQIYKQAKIFGCQEVIICSDQGPTIEIFDRMNYSADDLKEYARSYQYLNDDTIWVEKWEKEEWRKNAKHIMFSSYFQNQLNLSGEDFIEVIYDDFSDIDNKTNKIDDELIQGCQRFLDDMKRVESEKKKKEEEERIALEEREARRKYWAQKLYSDESQAMTVIIPEDSKLKK